MAYILTEQLHDEVTGDTAFARYQEYLRCVRGEFPSGAYALATSDWYFDSSNHQAPHDAWLESVTIAEAESAGAGARRSVMISLRLLGAYHDGHIELHYRDVSRHRVELQPTRAGGGTGHQDWRYDEFRLAPGGRVEHEIEWWGAMPTGTWLIEAADVEFRWFPSDPQSTRAPA